MKRFALTMLTVAFLSGTLKSQEKFGNTLNLGLGIGYYGYNDAAPAVSLNYEFDVARNFTLAPFIAVSTHKRYRYWGDGNTPYRDYYYRETTIPLGVKGSYYFDELFRAGDAWDFYAAASVGATIRTTTWESGYYGNREVRNYATPLYLNLHIGSEWHATERFGLFLDLSTGLSTFGFAFHFN